MASTITKHGWLAVCDIQGLPNHQMSCGQLASGVWNYKYCFLAEQRLCMLDCDKLQTLFGEDTSNSVKAEDDVFRYIPFDNSSEDTIMKHSEATENTSFIKQDAKTHLTPKNFTDPDVLKEVLITESREKRCRIAEATWHPIKVRLQKDHKRNRSVKRLISRRSSYLFCGVKSCRSKSSYSYVSEESEGTQSSQSSSTHDTMENRRRRQASEGASNAMTPTKEAFPTFLQRKIPPSIRRTKSSKATQGKENRPLLDMTTFMAQGGNLRCTDVELPFFMPPIESPDVIDLSTCASQFQDATVRPLHHSILGRDHCFEVVTDNSTRCFACESAGERQAWIENIKRAINPNLDNSRRVEHQLILFVQEAKGLPTKKKYFCEICLDRKLCARTTSKWKNDSSIFWGEHFEFSSIPNVDDVTIHLYKDSDKKKKKDKDYIGLVNLAVCNLSGQQSVEKWYTLSTPSGNNKSKTGESMAIRIKARFLSTRVLPTEQYKEFAEHVSRNYLNLCRTLGNVISVTRKDEIARILVSIMHGTGCIKEYMTEIVMDEVEKVEEESLIFRENTIGTKSVEAMLRLVGMKYLFDILGEFIHALFSMEEECEVDGSRLPPQASLTTNQKNLLMSCEIALCKIVGSVDIFPSELREVMASWRVKCEESSRPRIANRLVTASLFLRLLCPAILNPSLFGLANEVPDPKIARTLTLIAKVIQNLANRSRFGNKEEYMQFMDKFVREKWDDMGSFISNVSDPAVPSLSKGFQGFIDLGKEFAKLHAFFIELLPTLDQKIVLELGELPDILQKVTDVLDKPSGSSTSCYDPPPRKMSQEPPDLAHIVEDTPQPHDSGPLVDEPVCGSTPMSNRKTFPTSGLSSSSLLNQQPFHNRTEDGHYDVPASTINGFNPSQHGSQSSLSATCSYNNSNNLSGHWSVRQTLSSTENLMTNSSSSSKQPTRKDGPPLMFSNPAYHVQSRTKRSNSPPTSLTAMHDALNIQYHGCGRDVRSEHLGKPSDAASTPSSQRSFREGRNQPPLSFTNPLQAFSGSGHHLETIFTTETVTYTAPGRYPVSATPPHSLSGLRESLTPQNDFFISNSTSSEGTQSNDSSLSSRQSSTSTATNSNSNNSNSDPTVPPPPRVGAQRRQEKPRQTSNSIASKKAGTPSSAASDCYAAGDGQMIVTTETVSTSVSSAHLKTGLKTQNHRKNKQADDLHKPQPKPRSSIGQSNRDTGSRKTSAPCLSPIHPSQSPRRGSADNIRLGRPSDDFVGKYPSFQLKMDQGAILELNEVPNWEQQLQEHRQQQQRLKNQPSTPTKNEDGFVTDPVTAVKSRVMVTTSNANLVKTSKHNPSTKSQHKSQNTAPPGQQPPRRSSSYNKVSSHLAPKSASQSASGLSLALPPATPEGPLSPEARTAQWILNNVSTPNRELKPDEEMEIALSPKDYEDRINRLEAEVERLRACVSEGVEVKQSLEQKESSLLDKLRSCEKRETRAYDHFRRQNAEKSQQIQKAMQRISTLEAEHERERRELHAMIDSKESVVSEQRKRISKLERKLQRFDRPSARSREDNVDPGETKVSGRQRNLIEPEDTFTYIDDDVMETSLSRGHAKVKTAGLVASTSMDVDTDPLCNGSV